MYRPLTDDEKKAILRDGAEATLKEAQRRADDIHRIRRAAEMVWSALLTTPEWQVEQPPMPSEMTTAPHEQLWSVQPKVTFEQ